MQMFSNHLDARPHPARDCFDLHSLRKLGNRVQPEILPSRCFHLNSCECGGQEHGPLDESSVIRSSLDQNATLIAPGLLRGNSLRKTYDRPRCAWGTATDYRVRFQPGKRERSYLLGPFLFCSRRFPEISLDVVLWFCCCAPFLVVKLHDIFDSWRRLGRCVQCSKVRVHVRWGEMIVSAKQMERWRCAKSEIFRWL